MLAKHATTFKASSLISVFVLCFSSALIQIARADETPTIDESGTIGKLAINKLQVYPSSIELNHRFDYRQLLITGISEGGLSVDLTRFATLESTPEFVTVTENRRIEAKADGEEMLHFRVGNNTVDVQVVVRGQSSPVDPSFVCDVQPILSKLGCNAGTCHGSKDGKNGFKLSLRGYDAIYDWRSLADDIGARRINRVEPDQSLMLLKASGEVPHVGGQVTKPGQPHYELLKEWIRNGVKNDVDQSTRVTSIDVKPKNPMIPLPGIKQQVTVIATFSDGTSRDVSREAFIESGNIEVATANPDGTLNLIRRGEAPVLVRYEGAYSATILTVMGDRSGFVWPDPPTYNYIDQHVYNKLQRIKVAPSDVCTDAEFLRRVYIDLTGLPPSREKVIAFLQDTRDSKTKRDELVDELVGNPEYVEYWTNKWADLLQVNRKFLGEQGAAALRDWIKNSVATNQPYDEFAREILTASGSNLQNPPASYYKVLRDPSELMENTTHLFLAVRFNCNKCHDHPFERWTQDQYYEMAAFFAQINRKTDPAYMDQTIGGSAVEGAAPLVEVVFDQSSGEIKHDRTGEITAPQFPYSHEGKIDASASRRVQLAQWTASPHNPYFARSYVNRLWGYLFGVGIIEPIDDIRAGNPAVNPELLAALEKDFVDSGFDIQHMLKTICKSRVYQHSIQTNDFNIDDATNFSHALPRRLPAETLFDAMHIALGAPFDIPGAAPGVRATELPDAGINVPFLDDFGKPVRESACECERSNNVAVGPVMKLVNGPTVSTVLTHPDNIIKSMMESGHSDNEIINELFLRFFARYPTEHEISEIKLSIDSIGNDHQQHVDRFENHVKEFSKFVSQWELENRPQSLSWDVAELSNFQSEIGATMTIRDDAAALISGPIAKGNYKVDASVQLSNLTAMRIEALTDPSLGSNGPGRAPNGNFVLNEIQIQIHRQGEPKPIEIKFESAEASFHQVGFDINGTFDGNLESGWAIHPQSNQTHTAFFVIKDGPIEIRPDDQISIAMIQNYPDGKHNLGCFRIAFTDASEKPAFSPLPDNVQSALAVPADSRTADQTEALSTYVQSVDPTYQTLKKAMQQSQLEVENQRLVGFQDLAWALINSPSFLFNR
jgi:hypothetical protein